MIKINLAPEKMYTRTPSNKFTPPRKNTLYNFFAPISSPFVLFYQPEPKEVHQPNQNHDYTTVLPLLSDCTLKQGDATPIYRSKSRLLPEELNPSAFTVKEEDPPEKIVADDKLLEGLACALTEYGNREKETYYIASIGAPHLPGIAVELAKRGIESYFVITSPNPGPRFPRTLKYFAGEYLAAKETLPERPGFATLIDCHRNSWGESHPVTPEQFPSPEQLVQSGIREVCYLAEAKVGEYRPSQLPAGIEAILETYRSAGLKVNVFGIDARQGYWKDGTDY
jgi:hypothetical protein